MITIRRAEDRGHANHGWLDSYHTFSFANYYDPQHMGFRSLRVINEDWIAPGRGFGMHSHRDMEIISYVVEGGLQHKDSLGNTAIIRPGEVQRMTAGTGVTHSEYNPSETDAVHLLQIWLLPDRTGLPPSYEQKEYPLADRQGHWRLIASPNGQDGSVTINQDVRLYATVLPSGDSVTYELAANRHAWVQVVRGKISLNGESLDVGDAAAISGLAEGENGVAIAAHADTELLLFDLA